MYPYSLRKTRNPGYGSTAGKRFKKEHQLEDKYQDNEDRNHINIMDKKEHIVKGTTSIFISGEILDDMSFKEIAITSKKFL